MKNKIFWLRVSYWLGAVIDGYVAITMFFPSLFVNGLTLQADHNLQYGLLMGAPLMAAWTALLIWADHKPLERKGVLILTLPIILFYAVIRYFAIQGGIMTWQHALPLYLVQAVLVALFVGSYLLNSLHSEVHPA
jgi:hypothetical protein